MTFSRALSAKWLLRTALTLLLLVIGALLHVTSYLFSFSPFWIGGAALAVWSAAYFGYIPVFCRRFCGSFDKTAVRTQSGVWVRRQTLVPLSSLRTFEVWAPPLHRFFGCRTVILRFAGGSAWLPLLGEKTAACLSKALEEHAT